MKVTFVAYASLYKKFPSKVPYVKCIPGDPVEISDSFKDQVNAEDILFIQEAQELVETKPEVCPACLKIVSRCVCEKLASQKARIEAAQLTEEEEEEKEEAKKKEVVIVVDQNKVDQLIAKKVELKKSNKSKLEQKAELESYKKSLETDEPAKLEDMKAKGKLRKNPLTGEFFREKE
jgi:hypothetical protein